MRSTLSPLLLYLCSSLAAAELINSPFGSSNGTTKKFSLHGRDAETDPADFSWIKRWAAIGDSYTAGIGSGNVFSSKFSDWECSRYDHSYVSIANRKFGPAVDEFQYLACSGARTGDIFEQANQLEGDLDLVMLTAGGNDLCLVSLIKTCVFFSYQSDSGCQEIIDLAQYNIDNILKDNVRQILNVLNSKMKGEDSIVVLSSYAEFFNTENDDCATKEDWSYPVSAPFSKGLPLTKARRKKFNDLVINANKVYKELVEEFQEDSNINYRIVFSDWNKWPDRMNGQYCEPGSTGKVPDPRVPQLQFFKPDSSIADWKHSHNELRRRDLSEEEIRRLKEVKFRFDKERSSLWKTPNPAAVGLYKLDKRAPVPPNCPGDDGGWAKEILGELFYEAASKLLSWIMPDSSAKNFHPNRRGHAAMASFAIDALIKERSKILGVDSPTCRIRDEFKCWQKDSDNSRKYYYASAQRLNNHFRDFCDGVVPGTRKGWRYSKKFDEGTLDEHEFVVQLSSRVHGFNNAECRRALDRIINGCDGNDPENPLNWKYGGQYRIGDYTYEVNPLRQGRPLAPKYTYSSCMGWYKGFWGDYTISGRGWLNHDHGEALKNAAKKCVGGGITKFKFEYLDEPIELLDNAEWRATFRTPIWVRQRCFNNDKVQRNAGAIDHIWGCPTGND